MTDPDRLIVEALRTLERDPRGPVSIAQATAYATIAQAMLLRQFLAHVPVVEIDPDEFGGPEKDEGPAW